MTLLDRPIARAPIDVAVAIAVAHPDDETIALGGSLYLFRDLLLIHVTDGAPRQTQDAARKGFASLAAYARTRAAELELALALAESSPTRYVLDVTDDDAVDAAAMAAHAATHPVYEFPLYHGAGRSFRRQSFLGSVPDVVDPVLSPSELTRKRAMLGCFESQSDVLARFGPSVERLRRALQYDFAEPPHAPPLRYERWDWLSFADWRQRVARSACAG